MRIFLNISLLSLITAGLLACSVYKIDVQQGNTLDPEQIAQLKTGMTRRQVLFVLGSPMLRDPFHPDRWDYPFSFKPGGKKMVVQHLSLFFEGDKLVRIDNQLLPPEQVPRRQNRKTGIEDYSSSPAGGGHSH
ncbi:MAG TPA: outer membrane protein assembly factor BamE [Gammaproteobacteria bacterium]|nr:outer membrane protein assembly factor BamE [Gammaproteobacteria bacterium]